MGSGLGLVSGSQKPTDSNLTHGSGRCVAVSMGAGLVSLPVSPSGLGLTMLPSLLFPRPGDAEGSRDSYARGLPQPAMSFLALSPGHRLAELPGHTTTELGLRAQAHLCLPTAHAGRACPGAQVSPWWAKGQKCKKMPLFVGTPFPTLGVPCLRKLLATRLIKEFAEEQ